MSLDFGLQLYSVRDELAKDYVGTLEKVASIGYRNVELAFHQADQTLNVGGMTPAQLRETMDRLGLRVVSAHMDPMDKFDWDKVIAFNKELGNTSIGKGIAFYRNKQDVLDICSNLNRYGEICKKNGMQFYYHNHFQEFQKFDDQYVLDILLDNTDSELVKIELDIYWALRGGVDPINWLKQMGGRCDLVHLKDFPKGSEEPLNTFEVMGPDAEIDYNRFLEFKKPENFSEIGEGIFDVSRIVEEVRKLGYAKYIFVEQDLTTKNQLESVTISYQNFSKHFSK
ncbi:sugar phosphate isomerase/epimerase family protein [Paenibacillus rigui]|uniref:Xylose isomerase-like TIM barrel domain-containing protein n=1 Tax=Paenibacillus rigui TaxID=554312 RepID=A0A229UGQ6_9BACL|nr:sugar phosphate isomerase/epimerase [Paenibacillus rigui]OXM82573.1 hypothetical protein CF651_30285 [Paenibacillus rigui]